MTKLDNNELITTSGHHNIHIFFYDKQYKNQYNYSSNFLVNIENNDKCINKFLSHMQSVHDII